MLQAQDNEIPTWLQTARDSVEANPNFSKQTLEEHHADTLFLAPRPLQLYHFMMGASLVWLNQREKALPWLYRSLAICQTLGDTSAIISRHRSIAASSFYLADYQTTLNQRLAVLKLVQEQGDSTILIRSLLEVGATYYYLLDKPTAITYQRQASNVAVIQRDTATLSTIWYNLGAMYRELDQLDSARTYLQRSIVYMEKLGRTKGIARTSAILGEMLHLKFNNRTEAWTYLNRSIEVAKTMADSTMVAFVSIKIGNCLTVEGKADQAEIMLRHSLDIYEKAGLKDGMMHASRQLAEALFENQRYAAYREIVAWRDQLRDSIFQEKTASEVAKMQTLYETEKQNRINLELQKEREEQEREISQQKRTQANLIGGFVALLLIGGGITWLLTDRARQRHKNTLQQAVIQEKEKGLEAVFTATEEERKRIAKDLHDGIGQQLTALYLGVQQMNKKLEDEQQPDGINLLQLIEETARDTREISHQMMPNNLLRLGLVPVIEETLEKTLGAAGIKYAFEHFNLEERYEEEKEITVYRVFQELIQNVIKHAKASEVSVQLYQNQGELVLLVEDNGRGPSDKAKDGHGLLNIMHRITSFKGRFRLEPSPDAGTSATVSIPV